MCLYPKLIKNRKYIPNKKNGGNPPPVSDERVKFVPKACGNCMECRKAKARDWQARLAEDIKTNKNAKFVTLTFSDESFALLASEMPQFSGYFLDNEVATLAVRRFNERHRKLTGKAIRHWLITELGHEGTENIHLHGLIWTDLHLDKIEELWKYGMMWKGYKMQTTKGQIAYYNYVGPKTVNYITKYVHKQDKDHPHYKPITLTSAGIGQNYTKTYNATKNTFNGKDTNETYRTVSGHTL